MQALLFKQTKYRADTVFIILLAFVFQLGVLIRFSQSPNFLPVGDDMQFYADWGQRIAQGQWTDGKAFYGLPGYAYVLAGFFSVLGFDPFTVGFFQTGLFALVAGVIFRLALEVFDESANLARRIGWLAALGWIFFVPAQTFSTILMPTIWVVLAYWLSLLWLLKLNRPGAFLPWLLIGLAFGITSMMVATILLLSPVVLWTIWRKVSPEAAGLVRLRRLVLASTTFVGALFIGSAPASLHNYLIAHEPVMLSAHSGINFWIGNNPTASGYPKMPPGIRASQNGLLKDSIKLAEVAAGHSLTRAEVSRYWSERANRYIRDNFGAWLQLMGRKFVNFWNAYQYDDISSIKLLRDDKVTWPGLGFGFVSALGLAGMIAAVWRAPKSRWVAALVVLHLVALMPVFVTERYRLAAVPGLLLFAGWWVVSCWHSLSLRAWPQIPALLLPAVASAWFVSIPRSDASLWSLDHYKAGIRAIEVKQFDRAEENLSVALRYAPESPEINFALGNLALERRQMAQAKAYYLKTLALNPAHDRVLNNLGVLALEEERWDLSEAFILKALSIEAESAKSHYLLARARFGKGDFIGARLAIEQALKRNPQQREFIEFEAKLKSQSSPTPAPSVELNPAQ